MKKYLHYRNTNQHIENISHQFPYLYIIYIAEYIVVIHCIFCFILKPESFSFTCSHSLLFFIIRCRQPSRAVTCGHTLSFVVTRCHSLYQSLSFAVPRCHSLSLDVPLACLFINDRNKIDFKKYITQLYIRDDENVIAAWLQFLKTRLVFFQFLSGGIEMEQWL